MSATVAPSLADLHGQVQRRIGALVCNWEGAIYPPLRHKFDRAVQSGTASQRDALADDLRAILAAPDDTVRQMAFQQATDVSCHGPASALMRQNLGHIAMVELRRPRVTPREFVTGLANRGITLKAVAGGKIEVRPASLLTDADREVIRKVKPDILAVLAGDAETL